MTEVTPTPVATQPATVAAAVSTETNPAQEPSKTIFARNLPSHLNELEFTMLFQKYPGYVTGRVKKNKEGAPIGFVEFDTIEHCIAAKNQVSIEQGDSLVLEFSHTPRSRQIHPHPFIHYPRNHRRDYREMPLMTEMEMVMAPPPVPLSSTLFISNVPPDATPREMSHIFRNEPGYRCVRFVPSHYGPHTRFLCFVEFNSPMDAGRALEDLQSYQMDLNNPSSQLMISFARSERKTHHM